ncbi:myb-like protein A isoform X3 [Mizuhopecten yessoensis]|nr:myb-like protein A isoform X3 [Mizuhopecten yessoensis]
MTGYTSLTQDCIYSDIQQFYTVLVCKVWELSILSQESYRISVVQCGSILVSQGERTSKVKSSILLAPTTPDKRNKKTTKHALTIASSFGHVHSFLRDDDVVLNELEKKDANNKCLMLIKKPKSGAKQMLKSQSWANLSVSDSNLYKQLDGTYHSDGRRHAKYRMRRKQSDLQQVSTEDNLNLQLSNGIADHSNNNVLMNTSEKENHWRDEPDDWRSEVMSERSYQSSTLSHSQSQYRQRDGQSNHRTQNYGAREINNNKKLTNGNRMYSSHNDIYSHSKPSRMFEKDSVDESCALKSDELYRPVRREADIKEEEPLSDQVSRAHSLGDLTTGLTLSLVGQRKYESSQHVAGMKQAFTLPKDTTKSPEDIKCKLLNSKTDTKKEVKENIANNKESVISKSEANVNSVVPPAKPRRSLPLVPRGSDVSEKKKHYTEMVRQRINVHSSMSGSSSRQSVNTPQSTSDQSKRVSGTPSDREVSDLLDSQSPNSSPKSSQPKESQNGKLENISENRASAPVDKRSNQTLDTSDYEGGHYATMPSSVRGESGVTTVTSVSSTADSGYSTNDPENDVYSSSSYSKSLQKFAQSLYSNGKGYGGSHRRDSTSQRETVDFNSPFSPPNATSSPTKVNAPPFPSANNSDSKLNTKAYEQNRRHSSVMRSVSNGDLDPGVRPVSYGAGSPPTAMGNLSVYNAVPVNRAPRTDNSYNQASSGTRGRNSISSPPRGNKSVVSPPNRQGVKSNMGQNFVLPNQHVSPAQRGHNSVISPTNRHVSPAQRGHNSVSSPTNQHVSPAQRGHNSISSPTNQQVSLTQRVHNSVNSPTNRHVSQVQRGPNSVSSPANRRISPAQKVYNSMTSPPDHFKPVSAWNNVTKVIPPSTNSNNGVYQGHFKTIQDSQNRPSQQGGNPFLRNREPSAHQGKDTVTDYRSRSPRSERQRSPRSERQRSPRSIISPKSEPPRIMDYPVNALSLNLKHTRVQQHNSSAGQPGHSTVTRPMKAKGTHPAASHYDTLPGNFKFNTRSEEDSSKYVSMPCLFQILQSHDLASVRITIEDKSVFFNNLRLCECSVALPVLRKLPKKDNSLPVSPQGKYAQLGGPGSAFKPVKIPTNIVSFTMVAVADVSRQLNQYCDVGELCKGDIIIEVNESLVMADSVSGIKARIQEGPEEFVFTVARARSSTPTQNQKESPPELDNLRKQLESMKQELKRKERAIRELNAMLPWKPETETVNGTTAKEVNGNYASDSLVSGLSEDEFIV